MSSQEPIESYYYQEAKYNLASAIALPLVCVIVVGARFLARRKQKQPILIDDWLTIPALILTCAAGATLITGIAKHTSGYPVPSGPSSHKTRRSDLNALNDAIKIASIVEWAMNLIIIPGLTFVKLSVLFFYKRIFCPHKISRCRYFIIGMMVISTMWGVAFFFGMLFTCGTHFEAVWGSTNELRVHCKNTLVKGYALVLSDFIVDVIIILIPIPMIWRLQLSARRKFGAVFVLLLGSVAVAASATRFSFVVKIVKVGFDPRADEILTITGAIYWLFVELSVALLAACLPTISSLFRGFPSEAIIQNIKGAISLHSLRSNRSNQSTALKGSNRSLSRETSNTGELEAVKVVALK